MKAAVQSAADEELSIRSLMSKHESAVIIADPREYQIELFEKAKQQNTIAVLDTGQTSPPKKNSWYISKTSVGSGKTLIAVLLLRHIIDQELECRANGGEHRTAFFLVGFMFLPYQSLTLMIFQVDCVTLVFQQFAVLECNLGHKVERFCGEMGCDLWLKSTWQKYFAENMVIVCTAEILLQCLMHSFISIDKINLLIFDEAHHAKKNHAYARSVGRLYLLLYMGLFSSELSKTSTLLSSILQDVQGSSV